MDAFEKFAFVPKAWLTKRLTAIRETIVFMFMLFVGNFVLVKYRAFKRGEKL